MVSDDQAGIDGVRDRGRRVTDARMPVGATETNEQTDERLDQGLRSKTNVCEAQTDVGSRDGSEGRAGEMPFNGDVGGCLCRPHLGRSKREG
jgi:hypothetical protein